MEQYGLSRTLFSCCLVVTVLLLLPAETKAQERRLLVPTFAASAAAAADWASTYHALKHYHTHETNPVLRSLTHSPTKLVLAGALMDVGILVAWNKTVGVKKPKLAAAGLWVMTGFRAYLVVHNVRNMQQAARRPHGAR